MKGPHGAVRADAPPLSLLSPHAVPSLRPGHEPLGQLRFTMLSQNIEAREEAREVQAMKKRELY